MNTMSLSQSTSSIQAKSSISFDRRALIPLKENILWQIEVGVVRTSTLLEDGELITFGLWGPGDIVGKILAGVSTYQVDCLSQVKACPLVLSPNQSLAKTTFNHLQQLQELTIIRSYKRVEVMLLRLLSWLAQKFGQEVKTGQLIDLRMTHQDLADMLGSTRVTITRTLSQLEQQGLIERLSLHQIILREEDMWHYEI